MNIQMHIERMILEGVDIPSDKRHLLQAAVETELSRLLTERGIPTDWQHGGGQAHLSAPSLRLKSPPDARVLGAQIGAGVYNAIAGSNERG